MSESGGTQNVTSSPAGATIINASSGNVAAAAAVATLPAVAGKTTYVTGFEVTLAGATAASVVTVTVTGLAGASLAYTVAVPAGAALGGQPLVVSFPSPLPASAPNTAIVVTCPSAGAGNTNATVNAHGFQA